MSMTYVAGEDPDHPVETFTSKQAAFRWAKNKTKDAWSRDYFGIDVWELDQHGVPIGNWYVDQGVVGKVVRP